MSGIQVSDRGTNEHDRTNSIPQRHEDDHKSDPFEVGNTGGDVSSRTDPGSEDLAGRFDT